MSFDESTSRPQTRSFHGVAAGNRKEDRLQMTARRPPLLSLARKLHDNETALAVMRNMFACSSASGSR